MTPEEALEIKKPTTEKTLQSIDSTLKRIENLLLKNREINIAFVHEDSNGKRLGNKEKCNNPN